jgi:hypothetical protein
MRTSRGRFHPAPFLFLVLFSWACGDSSPARVTEAQEKTPAQEQQIAWNTIRSWSGSGDAQLDSFTSDTGALRIEWETKARSDTLPPGAFHVAIHSAISGRPLIVPIDHNGVGRGTVFVSEDPRVFFAVIESRDLAWSITIKDRLW